MDQRLDGGIGEQLVQHGGGKLGRTGGLNVRIEELLGLVHERAQRGSIACVQGRGGTRDDRAVERSEIFLHTALQRVFGKRVAMVEAV